MRLSRVALLLALLLPVASRAAPPDIDRSADGMFEVEDFGTYHLSLIGKTPAPDTVSGTQNAVSDVTLARQGVEVCAAIGTSFGFRYKVSNDLPDPIWRIEVQTDHPLLHYANGNSGTHGLNVRVVEAGTDTYNGWTFEEPGELEAGDYTFTLRRDGEVLLRKTFHIRTDCAQAVS